MNAFARGLQSDFGGFDPRFPGVTITVGSDSARDMFLKGWPKEVDIPAGNAEHAFEKLCLATVFEHEQRHFHDFLIAPIGSAILRTRLNAFINGMGVVLDLGLIEGEANCVPIPLPAWCLKPPDERRQLVAAWDAFITPRGGNPHRPPDLPFLKGDVSIEGMRTRALPVSRSEARDAQIRATMFYYDRLRQLITGDWNPTFRLQQQHLSEASALLVQVQKIALSYGSDQAARWLDILYSDLQSPYRLALESVALATPGRETPAHLDRMSAVVNWSLLGDPQLGSENDFPLQRFADLTTYLKREGWPGDEWGVWHLYTIWDAALDRPPTLTGVAGQLRSDDEYAARLEATRQNAEDERNILSTPLLQQACVFWDAFRAARVRCVQEFLTAPDDYVSAPTYLRHPGYPTPPTMWTFQGYALDYDEDMLAEQNMSVYKGFAAADGRKKALMVGRVSPDINWLPGDPMVPYDIFTQMTIVDVLFSPFRADVQEFELFLAREALGGDLTLRQILR